MANLTEIEQWDAGVYEVSTVDAVVGGPDGISNKAAKNLANRTLYLKGFMEAIQTAQSDHEAAVDPHVQYVKAAGDTMTGALITAALDVEGTVRIGTNASDTDTDLQFTDSPNIASNKSMRFCIDSDNNGAGNIFEWGHNSGNTTGLDSLMQLTDGGKLLVGYTVNQGAYNVQVNGGILAAGDCRITGDSGTTSLAINSTDLSGFEQIAFLKSGAEVSDVYHDNTNNALILRNREGGTTNASLHIKNNGDVDVALGTLKQSGVAVATLQSLLDGVGLGKSLAANGYATLPGGLIIQWGLTTTLTAEGSQTITLPIVWPNGGFVAHATPIRSNPTANATAAAGATLVGNNQITVVLDHYNSAIASGVYWIAIGW